MNWTFAVTDTIKAVTVSYNGILPDLFREGQGVVTEGKLKDDGTFEADTVLAKHDENYMPRELANSLKEKGVKLGKGQGNDCRTRTFRADPGDRRLPLLVPWGRRCGAPTAAMPP